MKHSFAVRPLPPLVSVGTVGIALALVIGLVAFIVPLFSNGSEAQHLEEILANPSESHLMGTDSLGRDQLSRVALGTQNSIATIVLVLAVSGFGGGLVGLFSGYAGGAIDMLVQRSVDALMAMPLVVLVLAVVAAVGASFWSVSVSIAVAFSPMTIRIARSSVLSIRNSDYIASAKVSGASRSRILLRHLLPNSLGPWAIIAASQAGAAVLVEAALAFLGATPGRITLGGLLGNDAQVYMFEAPWLVIWPGLALVLLALSANMAGDWVSDRASALP